MHVKARIGLIRAGSDLGVWQRLYTRLDGPSSNGRTPVFGTGGDGSNPSGPTPVQLTYR